MIERKFLTNFKVLTSFIGSCMFFMFRALLILPSWKTYTSKLFTKNSVGVWTVETVDSNNRNLNAVNFEVVYEKQIEGF